MVLDLTDGGDDMSISCVTGILSGVALIFLLTDGEGASILDEDLTGSLGVFTTTLLAFLDVEVSSSEDEEDELDSSSVEEPEELESSSFALELFFSLEIQISFYIGKTTH